LSDPLDHGRILDKLLVDLAEILDEFLVLREAALNLLRALPGGIAKCVIVPMPKPSLPPGEMGAEATIQRPHEQSDEFLRVSPGTDPLGGDGPSQRAHLLKQRVPGVIDFRDHIMFLIERKGGLSSDQLYPRLVSNLDVIVIRAESYVADASELHHGLYW